MERKAFIIGLLQSLSLFAVAHSDSIGTSMDCIEADMAKIMEYTETLEYPSANGSVVTDDERENLLPFGVLKTDWTRLQLLHDALPSGSILKAKFKHLFRLLLIAHEQTNRFVASSQSTKSQDKIESKTTVSIPIIVDGKIQEIDKQRPITEYETTMNSTDRSQQISTKFQDFSSTISLVSPKYDKDNVDAVMTKNSSQRTIVDDNEETTVKSNVPETNSTMRLPAIIATSKPILEMNNTDKHHDDLSVKTPVMITENPYIFSTDYEDISNEKKNSTITPASAMSSVIGGSPITVTVSSLSDNNKNPTSTEMFVKEEIENFSSTIGMNTKLEKNIETSANENFLSTTVLNFEFTQSPLDSTSRENFAISTKSKGSNLPAILSITRPAEREWSYENPSSTTISSSDRTKVVFSTSRQKEAQPSASTIENNLSTGRIKNEESSSESSVQSTQKVDRASERSVRPIGEYSSTLSSTNVYTDAIIQPITYSIEKVPIASVQDNEGTSIDYGQKIVTSEKSTESHEISNSTGVLFTSGHSTTISSKETNVSRLKFEPITEMINYTRENIKNSTISLTPLFDGTTISTITKNYSENPTPAIVVKETNLQSEPINKIETSKDESVTNKFDDVSIDTKNQSAVVITALRSSTISISTRNYSYETSTTAILEKDSNSSKEKNPVDKMETSKDEPGTKKIDDVSIDTGNQSTVGLLAAFSSPTVSTSTINYTNETQTPAIIEKDTNSSSEKQPTNKIETSKDESVTKKIDVPNYTGSKSTAGLISAFISSTFPTTVTNSTEGLLSTMIIKKETHLTKEKPAMNKTETVEDKPVTENMNYSIPSDTGTTSDENKNISTIITKPIYAKNYLHAGTPSGNHISRDFKHDSENIDMGKKKSESQEIILYETGGDAKTGNMWRPHISWKQPDGNNIRRFDKYPDPLGRYGYQRVPSMKTDIDVGSGKSVKWPFLNRTNLLGSGKRDSVNADIEKQFRSYYREGKIDPSKKSRIDENHKSKIMIQCKNV